MTEGEESLVGLVGGEIVFLFSFFGQCQLFSVIRAYNCKTKPAPEMIMIWFKEKEKKKHDKDIDKYIAYFSFFWGVTSHFQLWGWQNIFNIFMLHIK